MIRLKIKTKLFFRYLKHQHPQVYDPVREHSVTFDSILYHQLPTWRLQIVTCKLMAVYGGLDLIVRVRPSQNKIMNVKWVGTAALQYQLIVDGPFAYHSRVLDIFTDGCFDHPLTAECGESRRLIVQFGDKIISPVGLELRIWKQVNTTQQVRQEKVAVIGMDFWQYALSHLTVQSSGMREDQRYFGRVPSHYISSYRQQLLFQATLCLSGLGMDIHLRDAVVHGMALSSSSPIVHICSLLFYVRECTRSNQGGKQKR